MSDNFETPSLIFACLLNSLLAFVFTILVIVIRNPGVVPIFVPIGNTHILQVVFNTNVSAMCCAGFYIYTAAYGALWRWKKTSIYYLFPILDGVFMGVLFCFLVQMNGFLEQWFAVSMYMCVQFFEYDRLVELHARPVLGQPEPNRPGVDYFVQWVLMIMFYAGIWVSAGNNTSQFKNGGSWAVAFSTIMLFVFDNVVLVRPSLTKNSDAVIRCVLRVVLFICTFVETVKR